MRIKNIKKIIGLIIFFVIVCASNFIDYGNKVFEVKNPSEIFIDLNNNLVFDEKEPFVFDNIHYINKNTNLESYPILKQLTDNEKFFLEYMAIEKANNLLKNKYVKLKDNDIFIKNKSYTSELLKSKYVFDDTEKSQQELLDNIKSINLDDYVILNTKTKKYHKFNCESGRKSNKYKIVKLSEAKETASPCKSCHLTPIYQNEKPQIIQKVQKEI